MGLSSVDLITKLIALLKADADVADLFGEHVYTHVPQGIAVPYLRLEYVAEDGSLATKQAKAYDGRLRCHTIFRKPTIADILAARDALRVALDGAALVLETGSGEAVDIWYVNSDEFTEPDGETRHGIETFNILHSE